MQIATLMSGSLAAQVIMFAAMPIITRLYSADEFGMYSLFFSIISIVGVVSSWKYDLAIMLPKSDRDAQALVFLSIGITTVMTAISIIVVYLLYDFLITYFTGAPYIIWLIPLGIGITGFFQIFNAYSSRQQFYKKIATVKVSNSLLTAAVQGFSKFMFKFDGLVLGKIFADMVSVLLLLNQHVKRQTLQLKSLSRRRLIVNAKRHDHFPRYQSFTVFLNAISQNLPVLLLAYFYSAEIAGFYALTVRILQAPIVLIGSSTREVYYQKASKMYAEGKNIFDLYLKTTKGLVKLFILPLIIVGLTGEALFGFIFGASWEASGVFAQILILWFFFLFINTPSIITYSILKLQKVQLKIEIVSLVLRFLAIYLGFYFFDSYLVSVTLFSISSILINIYAISFIYFKLHYKKEVSCQ
ncbi:MAG: hypothetical protein QG558_877 [Campylobacterota bacterium]|nr:hypothetical protein [Campylobacterota bacterium]